MPRDKDLKRLVRSRMQKTGESYTAARSHLVTRSTRRSEGSAREDSTRSESARSESARSDTITPAPFTAHVVSVTRTPSPETDKGKAASAAASTGEIEKGSDVERRKEVAKGTAVAKGKDIGKRDVAKRKDVEGVEEKDYATIAGMSDETIREKTGHGWEEWVRIIEDAGGAAMSHGDRASLVNETYGVDGWWSQCVTVGYERLKGMRARGQRMDGSWEATKSRTFDVPLDALFDAWADGKVRNRWLGEPAAKVRTATAPKSMRLQFPDGTIVAVGFYEKGASRSTAAVQHTKLQDGESAQRMKAFWKDSLDALAELLVARGKKKRAGGPAAGKSSGRKEKPKSAN
jgi:uncharacterized protein YndB with AHSA1/START domain